MLTVTATTPVDEALVEHLNLQNKRHRRFQRDAAILALVHGCSAAGIGVIEATGVVCEPRASRKRGFKIDVAVTLPGYPEFTYPFRFVTRALLQTVAVMVDKAGAVTVTDLDTNTKTVYSPGQTLSLMLYIRPWAAALYEKLIMTRA
jgi:hypothetical protein